MRSIYKLLVFVRMFINPGVWGNEPGKPAGGDPGPSLKEQFKGRGHWGGNDTVVKDSEAIQKAKENEGKTQEEIAAEAKAAEDAAEAERLELEKAIDEDEELSDEDKAAAKEELKKGKTGDKGSEAGASETEEKKDGELELKDDDEIELEGRKMLVKDLNKLIEKVKKEVGEDEFESANEKVQNALLVKEFDAKKAIKAIQKKGQDNNETKAELQKRLDDYETAQKKINEVVGEKTARIKELEAELKAKTALAKTEIDDELDDEKKLDLKLDKREAAKELPKLEAEKKKILAEIDKLSEDSMANYTLGMIAELQVMYDELATSAPAEKIINDKFKGHSKDDAVRAQRVKDVIVDYLRDYPESADRAEISISEYYAIKKQNLPELKAVEKKKEEKKGVDLKKDAKSVLQRIIQRQKNNPSNPRGTSTSTEKKDEAETAHKEQGAKMRNHWKRGRG